MRRRAAGFLWTGAVALLLGCTDAATTPWGNADSGSGGSSSSTSSGGGASSSSGAGGGGSSAGSSSGGGNSSGNGGGQNGDAGTSPVDGGTANGADGAEGGPGLAPRFACPPGPFPAPVAGSSQTVCANFAFKYNWFDGPTWIDSEQAFFFSNYTNGAAGPADIIKYTPGGACETWLAGAGCNGLSAAYDGTLIAVCQGSRAVLAFDIKTKQPKTLASMYMGQMLDSPNDVVAHSNGSIFFTNPTYELGGRPQGVGPAIFYIDPGGTLNLIAKTPGLQPNGIALSPDETHLYVEEDGAGTKVFDLDATGAPSGGPRDFAGGTDGLSVDCAGNLYLAGGSIISPAGMQVGSFPGGTMGVFGGADGKTLFVVANGSPHHTVQMTVPGPPH